MRFVNPKNDIAFKKIFGDESRKEILNLESADSVALKSAYEVAERFRWTKDELDVYDYWGIKAQDERGALIVAENRGRAAGRKEGIEAGRSEERIAIARAMLAEGISIELIAKITRLGLDEIAKLAM